MWQFIDVTASQGLGYTFEAWLAGFGVQGDHPQVFLEFYDASYAGASPDFTMAIAGSIVGFDGGDWSGDTDGDGFDGDHFVDTADSSAPETNKWKLYSASGVVPATATRASVLILQDTIGANGNDNYVDLISLEVVPEPASAALLGLGALAMLRRRR